MTQAPIAFITYSQELRDLLNAHFDEGARAIMYRQALGACHLKALYFLDYPKNKTDVDWIESGPAMRVSAHHAGLKHA